MRNNRAESRLLCSHLLEIEWVDREGVSQRRVANLEDISAYGACVQLERPIPINTPVRICHDNGFKEGRVRYCLFRDGSYFVGVQLNAGHNWSVEEFRPQHLLDITPNEPTTYN